MSPDLLIPPQFEKENISLEGRSILISDAATDIGRSLSIALAERGATLLLLARKGKTLNPLYDLIVDQDGPEPMIIEMDLTKANDDHYTALLQSLQESYCALHGLVNLSLSSAPLAPTTLTSATTWHQCYEFNLIRPMLLTRALLPMLEKSDNASVVFYSLSAGRQGTAYWGPLGAACAGIENMSQTLAQEFPSVRFNTLDVGKVSTDLRHTFYPAEARSELRRVDDDCVMDHFLYLLSNASKDISGAAFTIPNL
ncbi:MAG: SDR family NAD(P)-dependent oxidoreductase [Arenicellales bacterium]